MKTPLVAMIALLFIILILSRMARTEAFDNTGALINLASTSVRTVGEVRAAREEEARQVAHDLADMTE
jgi:hypothetical protein